MTNPFASGGQDPIRANRTPIKKKAIVKGRTHLEGSEKEVWAKGINKRPLEEEKRSDVRKSKEVRQSVSDRKAEDTKKGTSSIKNTAIVKSSNFLKRLEKELPESEVLEKGINRRTFEEEKRSSDRNVEGVSQSGSSIGDRSSSEEETASIKNTAIVRRSSFLERLEKEVPESEVLAKGISKRSFKEEKQSNVWNVEGATQSRSAITTVSHNTEDSEDETTPITETVTESTTTQVVSLDGNTRGKDI